MRNVTNNKSFGSGLTYMNEARKSIDYTLDGIFDFFEQSDLCINYLTGYKNMT